MADETLAPDELDEQRYTRLCDQVDLHLRLNRIALAEKAAAELLQRWPERTTAQERAGDVAFAQGKIAAARAHYRKAIELEPANADAEGKYGLALVTVAPEERRRQLIDQVVADPSAHQPSPRKPLNAALNALIFPGLGQLYNREHEKGLALVAAGGVLLMLLFYELVQIPYGLAAKSAAGDRLSVGEQWDRWQAALTQMSGGYWLLAILLIAAYVGLYGFGVYDAWRRAQSLTEKDLGVL